MLDFSRTRIDKSREIPILPTVTVDQEGLVLQLLLDGGKEYCRPSNATANSLFAGISWGERFGPPATMPRTEVVRSNSLGTVVLSKAATAGADCFVAVGTGYGGTALANVASGTPTNAQFKLDADGVSIITHTDHADKDVFVTYRYNLTVIEAQALIGDAFPGQRTHAFTGKAGVILGGIVYTDCYDTSVNWGAVDADNDTIKGGANGRVVGSGNGCTLQSFATVVSAPSAGDPWLGLYIDR